METYDNDLCALIFYFPYRIDHLLLSAKTIFQFIDSDQPHFDTFHIHDGCPVIAKCRDAVSFQILDRILIALISVIVTVVIGKVCGFHAALGKNLRIGRITLESKGFLLPVVGSCQSSLHICHGEIICGKNVLYILEKVSRIVFHLVKCIKAGTLIKIHIGSECTVTNHAYRNGYRLRCRFRCRCLLLGIFRSIVCVVCTAVIFLWFCCFFLLFLTCCFFTVLCLSVVHHFGQCSRSYQQSEENCHGDQCNLHVYNFLPVTHTASSFSPSSCISSLLFFIHLLSPAFCLYLLIF